MNYSSTKECFKSAAKHCTANYATMPLAAGFLIL